MEHSNRNLSLSSPWFLMMTVLATVFRLMLHLLQPRSYRPFVLLEYCSEPLLPSQSAYPVLTDERCLSFFASYLHIYYYYHNYLHMLLA